MSTLQEIMGAHGLSFATGGVLQLSYTDAITAKSGGGQGSATQLTTNINNVTVVGSSGDSVKLPPATVTNGTYPDGPTDNRGIPFFVINSGANTLAVFPDSGSTINALAANTSVNVAAGEIAIFVQTSSGAWFSTTAVSDFFNNITLSGFLYESAATGITAGTTRTQAGATALTKEINRVDTSTAPAQSFSATASFTNASTTISMPSPPPWITAGMQVYDSTASAWVGTISTWVGTTLTLQAASAINSSGSTDSLLINGGSTLGDGVVLPASVAGLDVTVINNTANIIQVYGAGSDTINGVGATTGVAIPPGDAALFECAVAGAWFYEAGMGSSSALPVELAVDNVNAQGSSQGTAFNLSAAYNRVISATAGTQQGVRLPTSAAGLDVMVENHSGSSIQVYGASTDTIDDVATATGVVQMDSSVVIYTCYSAGKWYSNGLATGYAKNPQSGTVLETMQYKDNISAAGTNQGNATQLSAALNTVSTVSAGQGVNLPASAAGLSVVVQNNGANPLQVYAQQGSSDTINGVVAANGVTLNQGTVAVFNCTAAGAWTTQPNSTSLAAFNTVASAATITLTAANITGGSASVDLSINGVQGGAITANLPTVAAMVLAMHAPAVGSSFRLRIINSNTTQTVTVGAGAAGWSVSGAPNNTLTIGTATWRDFIVKLTSLSAATLSSVATGTFS